MEDPSGLGEWRPDPTGRHQLRWWDGTAWSDNVADQGETSIDAMDEDAPQTSTVVASTGGRSIPRGPIVAGGVAALIAIAVALIVFTGGDDAGGFGEFTATLDSPTDAEVRTINVPAKSLVRVTATADAGFTPPIFAITDRDYIARFDKAADLSDFVAQSDLDRANQAASKQLSEPSDLFDPADAELARLAPGVDVSGVLRPGDVLYNSASGYLSLGAPIAGEFRILIAGAQGQSGRIRIKIERVDIGGDSMAEFFSSVDVANSTTTSS